MRYCEFKPNSQKQLPKSLTESTPDVRHLIRYKQRLTLRDLNQLRKARDKAKAEYEEHLAFVAWMYQTPEEETKLDRKKQQAWQRKQQKGALKSIKDNAKQRQKLAKQATDNIHEDLPMPSSG